MSRRCLVFGGNGFIGSHLVESLLRRGFGVRVVDVTPQRSDVDWGDAEYCRGSLQDEAFLEPALAGMDVVFHLASTTVPSTSNDDPLGDIGQNLCGSVRLAQAAIKSGIRRLVFFSSGGTVYGNPTRLPVPEDHPLEPICSYGVVKVAVERYLLMYQALGQLDPLILRPGNPYGPRQSGAGIQGVIPAFLECLRREQPIRLWGDGTATRDFLYITDLAELAANAAVEGACGVFNVGSGQATSLHDVLATAERVTGRRARVEYMPARRFDVKDLSLDIARIQASLAWRPQVSLEDGIRRTWRSLLESSDCP